jgi:hypothetical protein
MDKSTFAGKSTEETIRNYAEMLIDDLNSNLPENAGKHWDKARELDNQKAKQIFGVDYSDSIGQAYHNCLTNYKTGEMIGIWKTLEGVLVVLGGIGTGAPPTVNPQYTAIVDQIDSKYAEIRGIVTAAISICPQSADLHGAAAWIGVLHLAAGTLPPEINRIKDEKYHRLKPEVENHINQALEQNPGHKQALEAQARLKAIDEQEFAAPGGCFIATAAYGTPFAGEIDVLRNWRDDFLQASYPGRAFIKAYYSLSPPVANNISESDAKRKIVRTALGPIVKILKDKYSD